MKNSSTKLKLSAKNKIKLGQITRELSALKHTPVNDPFYIKPDQLYIKLYKARENLYIARYVGATNTLVASGAYLHTLHTATFEAASAGVCMFNHHKQADSYLIPQQ